jgi:crotonobetainyl-CoA:carnitine CoA-transferase CaiB-like acyl-CoA transferase
MSFSIFLGVVAAFLSVAALVSAVGAMQTAQRWRARCESLEASVAALRREVELVASISVKTGRRVQRVESEYSDVADRVDVVESRAPTAATGSLDQAIEWARGGADTDKLTEQFGLSGGEAELVARLHGRKKSA